MKRHITIVMFLLCHMAMCAQEDTLSADESRWQPFSRQEFAPVLPQREYMIRQLRQDTTIGGKQKFQQLTGFIKRVIRAFDDVDSLYVERNKYNWEFMLQTTHTQEKFGMANRDRDQYLRFGSQPGIKVGPYLGWRFIFLGYTFDVGSLGNGKKYRKTEFNLSFYSSMLGGDLFYRRTGSDFHIDRASGFSDDLSAYEGNEYDGVRVNVTGANFYYISNHRRFSYPAAFAQSTVQRRSAGSWKFGISITQHNIRFDMDRLPGLSQISDGYGRKMRYMDYSISAGYAYNWVFHHNWVFSLGAAPSLGYKRTGREFWQQETGGEDTFRRYFLERGNLNANINARAALVWNNSHYYGGLSFVLHNFNYRYHDLVMHNTFFTTNLYIGLNFMKRKWYRQQLQSQGITDR